MIDEIEIPSADYRSVMLSSFVCCAIHNAAD